MGYGEFGGTGSVGWRVVHSDPVERKNGWDPQRHERDARFIITVDGKPVADAPITSRVRVIWPPDTA